MNRTRAVAVLLVSLWFCGLAAANTPLAGAIDEGDTGMVEQLLEENPELLTEGVAGQATALHRAVVAGGTGVLRVVLEHEPDLNARDSYGRTPLHLAAQHGNIEAADRLLKEGASTDIHDSVRWYTPLHTAIANEHLKVAALLLERGASIEAPDTLGRTPLHAAGLIGIARACDMLIQQGAQVNARDVRGHTALHLAAAEGQMQTMRCLLKNGADPAAEAGTPIFGRTWYAHPIEYTRIEVNTNGVAPHSYQNRQVPHHYAGSRGQLEALDLMLQKAPGSMNAEDVDGFTPLHLAVLGGRTQAVQALVEAGARVQPGVITDFVIGHVRKRGHEDLADSLQARIRIKQ